MTLLCARDVAIIFSGMLGDGAKFLFPNRGRSSRGGYKDDTSGPYPPRWYHFLKLYDLHYVLKLPETYILKRWRREARPRRDSDKSPSSVSN